MIKNCEICNREFNSYKGIAKICSKECKKIKKKYYDKIYVKRDDIKQRKKEQSQTKEFKKKRSVNNRKYRENHPEAKQRDRDRLKQYSQTEQAKEYRIRYYLSHRKERKEYNKQQRKKPQTRERMKKYGVRYANGQINTKKILDMNKKFLLMRKLYCEQGLDTRNIALLFKTNQSIILAVLRRNNVSIKPKAFHNQKLLVCSNGVKVKSNSERRIAEYLIDKGIDFIYEHPIHYQNTTFFPDFYLPEKDLFVEFAGLTDKKWYVEQLEKKKKAYEELNKNVSFITKPEQIIEVIV